MDETDAGTRGPLTRAAVGALLVGTLAIAAAYASAFRAGGAPAWAAWLKALGVPLVQVATMVLGAARRGRVAGGTLAAFAALGALLAGVFGLALALPAGLGGGERLWLGLPRRAAVIVYGIGLLPALVLPVVYALTFDAETLRPEDQARVEAAARAARAARGP
ncbi:hypothetical protein [Roseisolibacter sp. H3M3-2]|uniref:hypothetical protein n=1 Tax=Roseisolibacter sp. H3M3-2 TaxID=3031323 RepID=UPI0023DBB9D9|nr:hypothetical protein [Roseisolibacter sp. H3M3-2]MDF1503887.1 hypothetical protein [Roseisolibacter sp. H3M3-2]